MQTLVLLFADLRVSALRWWPLTFAGSVLVTPPDNLLVVWFGANALAGFVPAWIESPIGWVLAGAFGGAFTGLVLAKLRISP